MHFAREGQVPANGRTEYLDLTEPSGRKYWGYKRSGHGVPDWAKENELVPVGHWYVLLLHLASTSSAWIMATASFVAARFAFAQDKKQ